MIDYTMLRQLAEAAPGNGWFVKSLGDRWCLFLKGGDGQTTPVHCAALRTQDAAVMAFIAAANPQTVLAMLDERDALRKFKSYTHQRLDEMGVPVDPDSPHKEKGCRIGGRMDWIEEYFISAVDEIERHRKERDTAQAEVEQLSKDRYEAWQSRDLWRDRYMREVEGLNNEGDPIVGDPPSGLRHRVEHLTAEVERLRALIPNAIDTMQAWAEALDLQGDSASGDNVREDVRKLQAAIHPTPPTTEPTKETM